ncbi:MAG: hypothetical protein OXU20_24230, partial [Myxococcales bacterium]|nr:hypothetical protein [Myxococcales bacterium]
ILALPDRATTVSLIYLRAAWRGHSIAAVWGHDPDPVAVPAADRVDGIQRMGNGARTLRNGECNVREDNGMCVCGTRPGAVGYVDG